MSMLFPEREEKPPVARDIELVRTRDAYATYLQQHTFQEGQLIQEKDGLRSEYRNARNPNNVYIVTELKPDAAVNWDSANLSTYGLRYDVQVGFYDLDGDFCFMWIDGRRFEPAADA
jgi:hypothetical protein